MNFRLFKRTPKRRCCEMWTLDGRCRETAIWDSRYCYRHSGLFDNTSMQIEHYERHSLPHLRDWGWGSVIFLVVVSELIFLPVPNTPGAGDILAIVATILVALYVASEHLKNRLKQRDALIGLSVSERGRLTYPSFPTEALVIPIALLTWAIVLEITWHLILH